MQTFPKKKTTNHEEPSPNLPRPCPRPRTPNPRNQILCNKHSPKHSGREILRQGTRHPVRPRHNAEAKPDHLQGPPRAQLPREAQRPLTPRLHLRIPGLRLQERQQHQHQGSALDKFYYPREKSKWFFTMMLIHEMTHVFQWHGNFGAPGGLTEGTADYVMVKSGIYDKEKYTKPGAGKRWDEGYGVTERFLEYCDGLVKDFTVKLNKEMRYSYSPSYWVKLLGKPVEQVWREYKAKYGNQPQGVGEGNYTLGAFQGLEY